MLDLEIDVYVLSAASGDGSSLAVISLFVAGGALLVAVVQVGLAWRQERRSTARNDVEWTPRRRSSGRFDFENTGMDDARLVIVEAWTASELVKSTAKRVRHGESVEIVLGEREENGPEHVSLPDPIGPPPLAEPPTLKGFAPAHLQEEANSSWHISKQISDQQEQMRARLRAQAESQQVSYRIVWRAAKGSWCSDGGTTG